VGSEEWWGRDVCHEMIMLRVAREHRSALFFFLLIFLPSTPASTIMALARATTSAHIVRAAPLAGESC